MDWDVRCETSSYRDLIPFVRHDLHNKALAFSYLEGESLDEEDGFGYE